MSVVQRVIQSFSTQRAAAPAWTPPSDSPTLTRAEYEARCRAGEHASRGEYDRAFPLLRELVRAHPTTHVHIWEYRKAILDARDWPELERLAANVDFAAFESLRQVVNHDLTPLERRIFLEVALDVCQSPQALAQLSRAVRYVVDAGIPGDFVECGVYRGASIVCIIRTLQSLGATDRTIWLYDTFEGMSEPEAVDGFYLQTEEHDGGLKSWEILKRDDGGSDWVRSEIDEVRRNVLRTGYSEQHLRFVKGKVEDNIPAQTPQHIALLRLDTDFYRSTKHELEYLYPLVSRGGPVIIDDYGSLVGARKAVDEYIAENKLNILLSRIDETVRMFVKPI